MARFKLTFNKQNNSHLGIKIAIREWVLKHVAPSGVVDVYGGRGVMFNRVWRLCAAPYRTSCGDAVSWLSGQGSIVENVFDVDPYASPYEALEVIGGRAESDRIGIACTDGTLRRVAMMRTKIPRFIQDKCGWAERDLQLMAAIYHQYPKFLRHVIGCVMPGWSIERLIVQYGSGTWRQATVYFAAILKKRPAAQNGATGSCD
jgi:hypothetical protein